MTNPDLQPRSQMARVEMTVEEILNESFSDSLCSTELSKIVLQWHPDGRRTTLTDIGAFCYGTRVGSGTYQEVDPTTLVVHSLTVPLVLGAVKLISKDPEYQIPYVLGQLVAVLASNQDAISDPKSLFSHLNKVLRAQAKAKKKGLPGLVNTERLALKILRRGFSISKEELTAGIRLLRLKGKYRNKQRYLSAEEGQAIAKTASDHFMEVSRHIIDEAPLPFKIEANGQRYLVTARHSVCRGSSRYTPLDQIGEPPKGSVYGADLALRKGRCPRYGSGRSDSEVRRLRNDYSLIQNERRRLEAANADPLAVTRRRLISEALISFNVYTYFDTGCNITTLQGHLTDGQQSGAILLQDIVDSSGAVRLSTLRGEQGYLLEKQKRRAKNKRIPVVFSSVWVKRHLPLYLELRAYLKAKGLKLPDHLIFAFKSPDQNTFEAEPNPVVFKLLAKNRGHLINQTLESYGRRYLNSRLVRNFKSTSITRTSGLETSAALLGHSPDTALEHYNRVSESEAQLQIAGAINTIMDIAVLSPTSLNAERLDGGGACLRPKDSQPVAVESSDLGHHAPDCRTKTGCWLCPHFAVHADEENLWKIFSYEYLLNEIASCSSDQLGARKVHKPIVDRLRTLVERILKNTPELCSKATAIEEKAMSGCVHPVYQEIVSVYEEVGVL